MMWCKTFLTKYSTHVQFSLGFFIMMAVFTAILIFDHLRPYITGFRIG